MTQSLQDRYAPHGVCFSCGPKTDGDSVNVSGKLEVHGETTARMKGIFVAVGEHHPAFYSWH